MATGSQYLTQATPGVAGRAVSEDFFGYSLEAGHVAGTRIADLVVAIPDKFDVRGAVQVFYGTDDGLSAQGSQLWSYRTFPLLRRRTTGASANALAIADFGVTKVIRPTTTSPLTFDRCARGRAGTVWCYTAHHEG